MATGSRRSKARKTATVRIPQLPQLGDNPIAKRIGPIFDPAWLKLLDEKTLREITVMQLDGFKEMLDVERQTVERIRSTLTRKSR